MAITLYFIAGLSDFGRKGSMHVETAHNMLESSLIKKDLLRPEDRVLIHEYPQKGRQGKKVDPPEKRLRASGIPTLTSMSAESLSEDLCNQLDNLDLGEADSLLIVAYSAGSAIFRGALAKAVAPSSSTEKVHLWVDRLQTIIHIGGMTLGWQFNSEMNKLLLWTGPAARSIPFLGSRLFPFQIYRGSKFIADTRIALSRHHSSDSSRSGSKLPETVYILGTKDQYISPADAIEPGIGSQTGNAEPTKQNPPLYLEASGCNHQEILNDKRVIEFLSETWAKSVPNQPHGLKSAEESESGQSSKSDLLGVSNETTGLKAIATLDLDDYLDPLDNFTPETLEHVRHVVIILHGIRDNGYWAKRIGHRIKEKWRLIGNNGLIASDSQSKDGASNPNIDERNLRVVTLSYGYFSLWDFIRPGGRRRAVEWFQNAYAEVVALYPFAEISFIGHSNGTYLGTEALKCGHIKFKLMLLAGSVVRRDFWQRNKGLKSSDKVERLLNIIALQDWIVGLMPGGFEMIPFLGRSVNLGGAGAYGFKDLKDNEQIKIKGGHGAGIAEGEWEKIASYVCNVHIGNAQAEQIGKTIGLPIKDADRGIKRINGLFNIARRLTGFALIIAFGLYLLPYLFAVAGMFPAVFACISKLPVLSCLISIKPSPYVAFFLLLIASAVARSGLKQI